MKLTPTDIAALGPKNKPYKVSDGRGLYIFVTTKGSKLWRMSYRFDGKQKTLSFGPYPTVSLEQARAKCLQAKKLLHVGQDPGLSIRKNSHRRRGRKGNSFDVVADEFLTKRRIEGIADSTMSKKVWLLDMSRTDLGAKPIDQIKPADILAILKTVEARGHYETAKRLRTTIGEVFRYAVATLRAEHDPTQVLRGALISPRVRHRPAITEEHDFGRLVRAIWEYDGDSQSVIGLKLMALLFPRPGELRKATWSEFDFNASVWTIPAERMKMRREHKKPLPQAALHLLIALRGQAKREDYIFPATTNPERPMSENTMNYALHRLGFESDIMTPHGFRSSASTLLNESNLWNPDAIEAELAHIDTKSVRSIYNRARYWEERIRMMDWWAQHILRNTNMR